MDELLNKIFQSELLTEDNKKDLKEAFTQAIATAVETAVVEARAQAEVQAKAEIAEQFVADKEALVEAVDTKLDESLAAELEELKADILNFRDLEVEYAGKLVEARSEMAEVVKKDMAELVGALDEFLEARITAEISELKEGIEEARKLQFGAKIFEAFTNEFKDKFFNEDESVLALEESKGQLVTVQTKLDEATRELKTVKREKVLAQVLESLTGRPREVMEVILKSTKTDELQETYNKHIGKVLHQSAVVEGKSEKENDSSSVLAEGNTSKEAATEVKVVSVTGDNLDKLQEEKKADAVVSNLSEKTVRELQKLAGINQ